VLVLLKGCVIQYLSFFIVALVAVDLCYVIPVLFTSCLCLWIVSALVTFKDRLFGMCAVPSTSTNVVYIDAYLLFC
jgi:hypothetical protein